MSSVTFADHPWLVPDRPSRLTTSLLGKGLRTAALAYVALFGVVLLDTRPAIAPGRGSTPAPLAAAVPMPSPAVQTPTVTVLPSPASALLASAPTGGRAAPTFADAAPLAATFRFAAAPASVVVADVEPEDDTAIPAPAVASPLLADVPVPMPRPADLAAPSRVATLAPPPDRHGAFRPASPPAAGAAAPDNRSFFERFFGVQASPGPTLAYAAPEDGLFGGMRRAIGAPNPAAGYGPSTAVYDITAHTVYMPDGTRLEAHSGLRERLDDPRYVHERMRGPTPPQTYDLKLREALFHGVQAIRLTPVGGSNPFGRTGLLAHTYMLGPNGDSNGCVSFRNYRAFLQAYMSGEIKRLVVVARLI